MERVKVLVAFLSVVVIAFVATTVVAAPLPNGTKLGITPGDIPGGFGQLPCTTGSCFSMAVMPGFDAWINIEPGTDGGFVIGKDQASGGQEFSGQSTTPGELSASFFFYSSNGSFYTAPNMFFPEGADLNIFDDAPCAGAACGSNTTPMVTALQTFYVAWNGGIYPMGSFYGCSHVNCLPNQLEGIFVSDYQIDPTTGGDWSISYNQTVPSGNFSGVNFTAIIRGTVTMPCDCPDDGNSCTVEACDLTAGCENTPAVDGTPCPEAPNGSCQSGVCVSAVVCDIQNATIRGGGQKPTIDAQIQVNFKVTNLSAGGCITSYHSKAVYVTPGTNLSIDWTAGPGPAVSTATLNGSSVPVGSTLQLNNVTSTNRLILDNKGMGGGDADRISIRNPTQ